MNPYTLYRSLLDTATATATADDTTTATGYGGVRTLASLPPKVHPNMLHNVPDIMFRVILITVFATVAIWANHEASKGFAIEIVNDAGKYSFPGKRFSIFYESNDKATRILLNTSNFVENLLYPNDQNSQRIKKYIKSVTLTLARTNFSAIVSVYTPKPHDYTIMLSPSLMESPYNNDAFVLAVLQGMARVWLWDGNGATPKVLLNGMVEYITTLAGFRSTLEWNSIHTSGGPNMPSQTDQICWKDGDPRKVARFLKYYDQRQQSGDGGGEVVRRLNKGMRNGWHDWMMDDVLGMTSQHACGSYDILTRHHHSSSSS